MSASDQPGDQDDASRYPKPPTTPLETTLATRIGYVANVKLECHDCNPSFVHCSLSSLVSCDL